MRELEKHPRLRGEDRRKIVFTVCSKETPPLARGRLNVLLLFRMNRKKHPRLRGEDKTRRVLWTTKPETPPLARGRQNVSNTNGYALRNTPACAGKTMSVDLSTDKTRNTPACAGKTKGFQGP